ncbi:MAG: VOC family protein [Pseudomonadota bacterium]
MIRGINHITLSISDLDRSITFYTDVLGCGLVARWDDGCYLEAGALWLALVVEDSVRSTPLPEYTHMAFDVAAADFSATADRVRQSGATVFQDNSTEGASLYFLDPDGHKLELHVGSLTTRLDAMRREPWDGLEILV